MRLAVGGGPGEPSGRRTARLREDAAAAERTGQTDLAIRLLEEAVRRAPDDCASLRRLAGLLERAGRVRAANACYRQLAESYEHSQLHSRAIAAWKRVAQGEPGFAGAHVRMGELYALQGLRAEARKHYRSALAIYRGTARQREALQVEERLAELEGLSDPGRSGAATPPPTEAAIAGSAEAGGAEERGPDESHPPPAPDDAEFLNERLLEARLFRRYALHDQARRQLEALLARFPDHAEARRELRDLLEETGRHAEAAEEQRRLDALESGERGRPALRAPVGGGADAAGTPPAPPASGVKTGESPHGSYADVELGDLQGFSVVLAGETRADDTAAGDVATPDGAPMPGIPADEAPAADVVLEDLGLVPEEETEPPAAVPHLPIDLEEAELTPRELRCRVNDQVERDDYETRYDLGIAYREMGLLDEAIAELQLASRRPQRFVECVSLLAACFLEKGLPRLAVKWLERGLVKPGLDDGQALSLRYDLAGALEACGERDRARALYTEVYGEDAGFRDVAETLRRLDEPQEPPPAGGGREVVLRWRRR